MSINTLHSLLPDAELKRHPTTIYIPMETLLEPEGQVYLVCEKRTTM